MTVLAARPRTRSPRPFPLVLLAALLGALGGCRTGSDWVPQETAGLERLPVESEGRWGSPSELRFGSYRADSIAVSWARGSGVGVQLGGIGTDRSRSRQEYRFRLTDGAAAALTVLCESTAREGGVGIRSVELTTSREYTLDCELRPAGAGAGEPWRLSLAARGDHGLAGRLQQEGRRLEVRAETGGSRVVGRTTRGWHVTGAGGVAAAVDPRGRVVWFGLTPADAAEALAVAATAVALLLYQQPSS